MHAAPAFFPTVPLLFADLTALARPWYRFLVSDAELVRAMAGGDRAALGTLYDRYVSLLLGVACRILRNERDAEDLVHDVFLEVWRHAKDFDEGRGTVRAWLVVRLRSRALDRLKSVAFTRVSSLETTTLPVEPSVMPVEITGASETARVKAALSALPADQRAVIELGYFEGLTLSEVADRLTIPVGTIKSRLARALSRLRDELHDLGKEHS